jgi:hypothetical protein
MNYNYVSYVRVIDNSSNRVFLNSEFINQIAFEGGDFLLSKLTELCEKWILRFESGRNWVTKLPSEQTRRVFIRNLQKYSEGVNKNPDELVAFKIEGLRNVASKEQFLKNMT